jgi:hypothetical protein
VVHPYSSEFEYVRTKTVYLFGVSVTVSETRVSFVPHLERLIWKMLIRRGAADSGNRNRNAQVTLDSKYVWIPKLDVAGFEPRLPLHEINSLESRLANVLLQFGSAPA